MSSSSSVFHVNIAGGGNGSGNGTPTPPPPAMTVPNITGYRQGQNSISLGRTLHFSNSSSGAPMEGVLSKWTNVMKGWQFRWFMLDENTGLLSYFTSKEKMRRGVRRGCIRLQGAVLGIDDEEDANFTVTVDAKVFHLQAKDAEEREIWVRALEDAIIKHARLRPGSYLTHHLSTTNGFTDEPLVRFEQRLAQADVYLQMLIQQIAALEGRIDLTNIVSKAKDFLEAVKHSIVLLQIAKNTAFPLTGITTPVVLHYSDPEIQTGIEFGSECQESLISSAGSQISSIHPKPTGLVPVKTASRSVSGASSVLVQSPNTPSEKTAVLFSYSSSDDEQDFYDASEDFEIDQTSSEKLADRDSPPAGQQEEREDMPLGKNKTVQQVTPGATNLILDTIDYDALYDDDHLEDDLGSVESHGSVLSHLLSQVKIGMDLTKVVLPTFILEKRSLLEMYADFFAHPDMFFAITDAPTPKDRIVAVLRWYLGAFHAGRRSEVAKKPYNPILGEIFQCYWDAPLPVSGNVKATQPLAKTKENAQPSSQSLTQIKNDLPDVRLFDWVEDPDAVVFFGEQVSHHPPISAFYAEHVGKKISLNAHIWTKSKFLGLSIGVHNIGHALLTIHFPTTREDYVLGFPNGYARSIFTVPWVELGGSVTISSAQTGYNAAVEFKTKPFFSGEKNKISAQVFSPEDKKKPFLTVDGEWNGLMTGKWSDGRTERFVDVRRLDIIKKRTRPIAQQEPYESRRLWKDVTAGLKFKNIEKATEGKFLLEEKQRNEARLRREQNETWRPKMFIPAGDTWVFSEPLEQRLKLIEKAGKIVKPSTPAINLAALSKEETNMTKPSNT